MRDRHGHPGASKSKREQLVECESDRCVAGVYCMQVVPKARTEPKEGGLGKCDVCSDPFISGARLEVGSEPRLDPSSLWPSKQFLLSLPPGFC